jgi:integrase
MPDQGLGLLARLRSKRELPIKVAHQPCDQLAISITTRFDRCAGEGVMAGSMRLRGKDSWNLRVFVGWDPVNKRRSYLERTVRGTRREASTALASLVLEAERLAPSAPRRGTVAALCEEWLAQATPSLSPRTVTMVRGYLDQPILPALGHVQVARLSTSDLDRFYRRLLEVGGPRGPYAPATIRRIHGILRRALTQGVRWGWIAQNPAIDASPARVPHRELRPPTPREVVSLFEAAEESDPAFAAFLMLAASTGARRGELIALRRFDVDLGSQMLSIERGIVIVKAGLLEQGTKSHQARRVSLDPRTSELLSMHFARQDELAASVGTALEPDAFVFTHSVDGATPWRPDSTTRAFRRLCARCGVRGVRLHDLRHYVATRLLTNGIDVRTVAGRLGHRNPSTTLNVYAHFVPGSDRDASAALARELEQAEGS